MKKNLTYKEIFLLRGVLSIVVYLFALSFSGTAHAYTEKENACYKDVNGTVSWSRDKPRTDWRSGNIRNLCRDVNQPAKRISCFEKGISAHDNWKKAIADCQNTGKIVSATLVSGKQCVYNKGGYILDVDWYNPGMVVFNGGETNVYTNYTAIGNPYKTDRINLGYSSCSDIANRVAIARVVGHDVANNVITLSVGTAVGITTGVAGAFACAGSGGAACPAAVIVTSVVLTSAVSATALALPDTPEIVYIGNPGIKNYVDLYGTVWEPTVANTVPISQKRNALEEGYDSMSTMLASSSLGTWVNGGKPSAKSITFNNQGVFSASMVIQYFEYQEIGGKTMAMPVFKSTGDLTLGFSRHINMPTNMSSKHPVSIWIKGVATVRGQLLATVLPGTFSGNKCFKSWGSIFDAQGGSCN